MSTPNAAATGRTAVTNPAVTEPADAAGQVAPRPSRWRGKGRTGGIPPLRGLLPLVVLLGLWQLFGAEQSPYFPRPSTWVEGVRRVYDRGELLPALGATTRSLLIALAVATLIGSMIGIAVGSSRLIDRTLGPALEFFRSSPSSAMVPIAVLLLGFTDSMKMSVTVIAALWPILLNARASMRELNPTYLDVAAMLHMSLARRIRTIIVPGVLAAILLGIRVSAPITLIVTLLVEILTGVPGLGALLARAQQNYLSAQVYGLLVLIGLLALVVNAVVTGIESWVLRYRPPS